MTTSIDLHIGRQLRARRRLLGLTQTQVAEACGVQFQQIQKYECGANRVSAATLFEACRILQVSPQYFYTGAPFQTAIKVDVSREATIAEGLGRPNTKDTYQ